LPDKVCFQCGQTNPQQAFCGACGSALNLNDYIARSVKEQLVTAVRDRDLLETESAINVFEKALGWTKLVGYAFGLVLAIITGLGIWKESVRIQDTGNGDDGLVILNCLPCPR
jgi:hypothetical protein